MMEWMPSCSTVTMTSHIPCTPPLRRTYKKLPGRKDTDRDIQKHHLIPTWVLKKLGIKQKKGPALQMDRSDHEDTRSFGKGRDAREFRHEILDMLEGGDISGAVKASLQDLEQ